MSHAKTDHDKSVLSAGRVGPVADAGGNTIGRKSSMSRRRIPGVCPETGEMIKPKEAKSAAAAAVPANCRASCKETEKCLIEISTPDPPRTALPLGVGPVILGTTQRTCQ